MTGRRAAAPADVSGAGHDDKRGGGAGSRCGGGGGGRRICLQQQQQQQQQVSRATAAGVFTGAIHQLTLQSLARPTTSSLASLTPAHLPPDSSPDICPSENCHREHLPRSELGLGIMVKVWD